MKDLPRQPAANLAISSLLSATAVADAPPSDSPALDWSDDLAVLDYSKRSYREQLDSARLTILDIMENGDSHRDRLAAAKEVNDQAGLPRKSLDAAAIGPQLAPAVLAGAFAMLRQMLGNSSVTTSMRDVSGASPGPVPGLGAPLISSSPEPILTSSGKTQPEPPDGKTPAADRPAAAARRPAAKPAAVHKSRTGRKTQRAKA